MLNRAVQIITLGGVLALCPILGYSTNSNLVEFDTVPNADIDHPAGVIGDVWTFEVDRRSDVTISVDTRDDNGDGTSNLDPILFLYDEDNNLIASSDDAFACTRPPVCGYTCPEITVNLQRGDYKVVVRDYNSATNTDEQCIGGAYVLSISDRELNNLGLRKDDKRIPDRLMESQLQATSNDSK